MTKKYRRKKACRKLLTQRDSSKNKVVSLDWIRVDLELGRIESVQVISMRKYGLGKAAPEFTSDRVEIMKILADSCIKKLDSIGMKWSRKP